MIYETIGWTNEVTPLDANNLNKMDNGIKALADAINGTSQDLINAIYPVGAIYMSVNSVNPGTIFAGTTWERWGEGRVPVGVGTSDRAFAANETGGASAHVHTNSNTGSTTLTANQIPSHHHSYTATVPSKTSETLKYTAGSKSSDKLAVYPAASTSSVATGNTGGSQGHYHTMGNTGSSSNLPPYITCYMWVRTA